MIYLRYPYSFHPSPRHVFSPDKLGLSHLTAQVLVKAFYVANATSSASRHGVWGERAARIRDQLQGNWS